MSRSRTKNVSRNATIAIVCQVINLLLNFLIRTVFIRVLGAEYLGVNGLFTNVLTILSFAELGIGNAIIFSLYKPLAVDDKEKIKSLMRLYKKAYTIIGIVVAVAGLCCTPFLDFIIKGKPDIPENIALLYLLFLANTVVSYFFVYKKNIIIADQRNYIVLLVSQGAIIAKTVLQVAFLYMTHQYIIYLVIQIVFSLVENSICSVIANRLYPYLKEPAQALSKEESGKIFRNVKALAIYKFGSVILNGTDNILISALIGVREVGLASNYVLLTSSCNTILSRVTEVFTSSVGNLNATEGTEKQYDIFKKLFFITAWIFGFASVGLATVSQQFITAWIGEDYLLSNVVLLAIIVEFYVRGIHSVCYTYRSTLGFFVEGKWSAVAAALINLVLSIIMCQFWGLAGIFIATPIARVFSVGIVDSVLVFKKGFNKSFIEYYRMCGLYTVLFVVIGVLCNYILGLVTISGWKGVLLDIVIVTFVFNFIVITIFFKTKMFNEIVKMVMGVLKRKRVQ